MATAPIAEDSLCFNADDARTLFERLDHIHLVAILPDAPKGSSPHGRYFGADMEAALDWASSANANNWNVYWTLNYVGPGVGTKPGKGDIQAARGAHCDLDPPRNGDDWDKVGAVSGLAALSVPPSLVIDSGNGLQPVWLLDGPEKDWTLVEAINVALRDTLGGDDCHNIDRLLRIPGSVNFPNKAKRERGRIPCMAGWAQEDTGQRYKPADLARAFPSTAKPNDRSGAKEAGERVPTQTGALIAAIRRGEDWHNNLLRLTAHLVARGRSTVEILAMADCLTLSGYSVDDTRADMRGMVDDARAKWEYAEPVDPIYGYVDDDGVWHPYSLDADEPPGPPVETLGSLDLAELAGQRAQPKDFAIERIAPVAEVTLFTGPGSAGKSLLAQQLATAGAAGLPCLGLAIQPGATMYATCEDDAGQLHWRQEHICAALGVDMASLAGKLHLVSLRGALDNELAIFAPDGKLSVSPAYRRLVATIKATGTKLVFLDNVAHLFTGNENDRGDVTRFINLLNRLAGETGAAIVLLGHPPKPGNPGAVAHDYSGSTAWLNAVRSQFKIDHDRVEGSIVDFDARVVTVGKANYAQKGDALRFRWHQWAFVREEDLPADTAREMAETIRGSSQNRKFLECLQKTMEQGENVSHSPSAGNYAPKVFAAMTIAKGYSKKDLEQAMRRLLDLGQIRANENVFQYPNRTWAKGLRAVDAAAQKVAQNPAQSLHEGCTKVGPETAENREADCTKVHTTEGVYTTYTPGAAYGPAAPDDDLDWGEQSEEGEEA